MYKYNYISGQKVGELTFLNRIENNSSDGVFLCQCGKEFITRLWSAKVGRTKSCGCLQPKIASSSKVVYKNGDKIDGLTYLQDEPYKKRFARRAKFLCHCGVEFVTTISNVKKGETKSCGCLTKKLLSDKGALPEKKIPVLSESDISRFWDKVAITANPDLCWNWQANGQRYGNFSIRSSSYKSNRVVYFLINKIDPGSLSVMHSCDNPKCCNPKHLSLGTHYDNMMDMAKKGRAKKSKNINNINSQLIENQ